MTPRDVLLWAWLALSAVRSGGEEQAATDWPPVLIWLPGCSAPVIVPVSGGWYDAHLQMQVSATWTVEEMR